MTFTSMNAGFYLQYLWELREDIEKNLGMDLRRQLSILSSFSVSEFSSKVVERKPPEAIRRLINVYVNLMSRGLPTLPSLFVERAVLDFVHTKISIQEFETAGAYRFINGRLNQKVEENWFAALRDAHFLCDPRSTREQYDTRIFLQHQEQPYDSDQEQRFYENYLPDRIGCELLPLIEAQRPLSSMLREEEAGKFVNQRADFAFELGKVRVVFEVDGPQHQIEPQKSLDLDRDRALNNNQWQVIRVPVDCLAGNSSLLEAEWARLRGELDRDQSAQTIRRLSAQPVWSNEIGMRSLVAVLSPFAVARFQRALLLALQDGLLSLADEQWKLVVVERDVPFAEIGLVDFYDHLFAFLKLYGIQANLPKVELVVYKTGPFLACQIPLDQNLLSRYRIQVIKASIGGIAPFEFYDGDLLIDVAVLSPQGYCPLQTEFAKQHLHSQGGAYEIRSMLRPVSTRRLRSQEPAPLTADESSIDALQFFLRNVFRKKEFREGQLEILLRAIALRPVIGLLPTGGGKSLCYQLAALLQPGLTLIIDPLISLMSDQMDNLLENYAIDWFGYINSQQTPEDRELAAQNMMAGNFLFVFISPERLQNKKFRETLTQLTQAYAVPYVVIDEAHCVSEWGHDFRTSYLKLGKTILTYCRHNDQPPTIIALTGTASYAVLSDVQREIGVDEESAKVYPKNFERRELVFSFENIPTRQKRSALIQKLNTLPNLFQTGETFYVPKGEKTYSGIVFTPHVNGDYGAYPIASLLSTQLQSQVGYFSGEVPNVKKDGKKIPVMLGPEFQRYKASIQRSFKRNEFCLLVATKAFGMGIDKPNIRYTIHYNIPQSLESFYQEAGRAGRDRENAHCIVVFSDDKSEEANWLLQPNVTSQQIRAALENNWDVGDIHRLLFLFTQTYRGIQEEQTVVLEILRQFQPILSRRDIGETLTIQIDFGTDSSQQARDKALYRLSILGVVSDYTVDHQKRKFEVTAVRLPDQEYINHLQRYIKRYKTREVSELVPEQIIQESGNNILEKCVAYLLKFVYQEIERKRRAAIRTMADVARSAARVKDPVQQNRYVWEQMLGYLEHSPFTEDLTGLSRQIEPDQWRKILQKRDDAGVLLLQSVDGVRQLLGGCRRALESDTENPGLLFLSSLARLLLPDPEIDLALNELRISLGYLSVLPLDKQESACQEMFNELNEWLHTTRDFLEVQRRYAEVFLDELPTRFVAREVYTVIPERSHNILLNLMVARLHRFSKAFTAAG